MQINRVEIKAGMVIKTKEENAIYTYVVFPLLNNDLGVMAFNRTCWTSLKTLLKAIILK